MNTAKNWQSLFWIKNNNEISKYYKKLVIDEKEITNQTHIKAICSSLLRVIIAHYHLPFFKYFASFQHFFLFFWKVSCMPLLSRIGPAYFRSQKRILWNSFQKTGTENCNRNGKIFQWCWYSKTLSKLSKRLWGRFNRKKFIQFSEKHAEWQISR